MAGAQGIEVNLPVFCRSGIAVSEGYRVGQLEPLPVRVMGWATLGVGQLELLIRVKIGKAKPNPLSLTLLGGTLLLLIWMLNSC